VPVAAVHVAQKLPRKLITSFFRIFIQQHLHSRWVTYVSWNLGDVALRTATNAARIWSFAANRQLNSLWAFTVVMRCAIREDRLTILTKAIILVHNLRNYLFLTKMGFQNYS